MAIVSGGLCNDSSVRRPTIAFSGKLVGRINDEQTEPILLDSCFVTPAPPATTVALTPPESAHPVQPALLIARITPCKRGRSETVTHSPGDRSQPFSAGHLPRSVKCSCAVCSPFTSR